MPSDADNAWNQMLGRQASATSHQASAEGREASATSHQASAGSGPEPAPPAPSTRSTTPSPIAAAAKFGAVTFIGIIALSAVTWLIFSGRRSPSLTPAPSTSPPPVSSPTSPAPPAPSPSSTAPLDLNTATAAQLEHLPGIGPALAARIIADRDKHGRYTTIDQLDRVEGIGKKTIEKLRPYLTVK